MRDIGMAFTTIAFLVHPAAAQTSSTPTRSSPRLLDVPYLPQTPELCGGAAVAMVMRYWGDRTVLPVDFRPLVSSSSGIVTADLVRDVTNKGWVAIASEAAATTAVGELRDEIDHGRPVIALVEPSPGRFHYVVVVGVTSDLRVVLHDPARTAFRVIPWDEFDRTWRASHRWQLLVLPPADRTARAPSDARISSVHARSGACGAMVDRAVGEADTDSHAAEEMLNAARELCPASPDPLVELAGLRFRSGRWHESADLAAHAVALDATDQDAWALLGTARLLDEDEPGALAAWNHIGEPSVDVVTIAGAERTPQPALVHLIGLEPRTVLTPRDFARARRRFADAPTADATRLSFTPTGDGRASVSASMVERDAWPHQPIALGLIAARAAVTDEVRVTAAGLASWGETITGSWRWPAARPRLGAVLNLPAPVPLRGVITIDGYWERQSYALPATDEGPAVVRDSRRRVTFNLGDWLSGTTKIDVGGGIDRFERTDSARFDATDYASLHGSIEQHMAGDHFIGRADAEVWGLAGDGGFSTEMFSLAWSSTTDTMRSSISGAAGYVTTSATAPRALWMGAGTGLGRPLLLRAHPLLDSDVVQGPMFGRQIFFSTTEAARPIARQLFGTISIALFVDAAQVRHTLSNLPSSPLEVDAGVGLRVRLSHDGGTARIDLGRGLRDGGTVFSVGWMTTPSHLFSRGMPW